MELTIKELSAYLPYGLKMKVMDISFYKYDIMALCDKGGFSNIGISDVIDEPQDFKPILYPLDYFEYDHIFQLKSHLGIGQWCDYYDQYFDAWFDDAESVDTLVLQAPYEIFQFFLEIKLDVFSLIPKGLAIAVTEDFNPYK